LLAAKLWQLTNNIGSSRLAVQGLLESLNGLTSKVVMQRETLRTSAAAKANTFKVAVPQVVIGSRMQYKLHNFSDRPLYVMIVGMNNSTNAIAFYPWQVRQESETNETKVSLENLMILPGQSFTIPETAVSEWVIPGASLFCEHQLIFSTSPFTETLAALAASKPPGARKPIATLTNPLDVAQALLQDLHNASAVPGETTTASEGHILDVRNWASLNFSFQVV
jgi:hypothetical protein